MSGYPDPNYAPPDQYPSTVGESCDNPKPYWHYKGATFCEDVNINGALTVGTNTILNTLSVRDTTITVDSIPYSRYLFLNDYDGRYYYVLANQLPMDFRPT
jgi:hypothetical protein